MAKTEELDRLRAFARFISFALTPNASPYDASSPETMIASIRAELAKLRSDLPAEFQL